MTVAMNLGNTLQDGIMTLCRVDSMADFDCTICSVFYLTSDSIAY
jgi:hypothetical protein